MSSLAEIEEAAAKLSPEQKRESKTALVKGLQKFNAELLFIASLADK
jgi:hypothetical protein